MPGYRGHLIGGGLTFIALSAIPSLNHTTGLYLSLCSLLACLTGSLFPDVDIPSKGRNVFYYLLTISLTVALWKNAIDLALFLAPMGIIPFFLRHRGITHNPFFLICMPLAIAQVAQLSKLSPMLESRHIYIFFVAGALSHVLLDQFVPNGKSRRYSRKKGRRRFGW